MLSPDPDRVLERLRAFCLSLPGAEEKLSHGAPAFQTGGKMFAYFRHNHHGDGVTAVCVKTTGREEQEMLLELDPDFYSWPAYIGPSGWLALNLGPADADWAHVEARVRKSYELVAPKPRAKAKG